MSSNEDGRVLYVSNLAVEVTDAHLRPLFEKVRIYVSVCGGFVSNFYTFVCNFRSFYAIYMPFSCFLTHLYSMASLLVSES